MFYLSIRKPWSIWGPNILHAWDKTSKCMILSGKREMSNATLPAVCETIALAASKPQRRNARSVNTPYSFFCAPCFFAISTVKRECGHFPNPFSLCRVLSLCGWSGRSIPALHSSTVKSGSMAQCAIRIPGNRASLILSFHCSITMNS